MSPRLTRAASCAATALLASAIHLACSSPPAPPERAPRVPSPTLAAPQPVVLSPARYVVTEAMGAQFDEAGAASPLPRPEPALLDGARAIVDGGVIVASAKSDDLLTGFRSLPPRLGGGFLLWSSSTTFKASHFLGDLTPVAPAGSTGGVRPWLSGVLLRTDRGLLELDPTSLALKRVSAPPAGIADGIAADARRAVRVDALGRASFTVDAAATWTDVLAERGSLTVSLHEEDSGILLAGPPGQPALRLAAGSAALEIVNDRASSERGRRSQSPRSHAPPGLDSPSSRSLAPDLVAHAAGAGALLPGGRALVSRPQGLALLATATARTIADVELTTVAEHLSRCQPFVGASPAAGARRSTPAAGSSDVLLLCSHARGAHVLRLEGDMASPKLEATFPDPGVFVSGERGRVAFAGRCGRTPPSPGDFRAEGAPRPGEGEGADEELRRKLVIELEAARAAAGLPPSPQQQDPLQPNPPPEEAPQRAASLDDVDLARVCVRMPGGAWVERRLTGADALRLYRWLPGDDGSVTAIVLNARDAGSGAPPEASKPSPPPEGVRVVRVDAGDAALDRGLLPAVLTPSGELPSRSVDPDFWIGDDGSLHGWVDLRSPNDEEREPPAEEPREGDPKTRSTPRRPNLPVSRRPGGRVAGVRIDRSGKLTVFPLPPDTEHVVHGGRFGVAMAVKDDVATYFETTDGGRSWLAVEGPPVGRMSVPFEGGPPFACSPLGCVLSDSVVRLGWGGSAPKTPEAPKAPKAPEPSPPSDGSSPPSAGGGAQLDAPAPPLLTCRFEGEGEPWALGSGRSPAPRTAPGRPAPASPGRGPAPDAGRSQAPLSILTSTSASLGSRREGTWSAEVIPPFSPGSPARRVSLRDGSLGSMHGLVAPILTAGGAPAGSKGPVDLLLLADKRRLRLSAASPSLLPFEQGSRVTVLVDLPGGDLAAFDADRAVLSLVPGASAARPALRLARVPDAARTRLTLARAVVGDGLAVVGYSTTSGEVFAGALDLGRAEVSPLAALGSLRTLGAAGSGACGRPGTYRFLADLPVDVRVVGKAGRELVRGSSLAVVLVSGSGERLCAEGVEAKLPRGEPLTLSAVFGGSRPASVIRSAGGSTPVTCSLEGGGG